MQSENKGKESYDTALKDFLAGDVEVQATIIAWPNEKGNYSDRIIPTTEEGKKVPKKGKHPLMLEDFIIEGEKDHILNCKTIKPLPYFPRESQYLEKEIPELGLLKGVYVRINPDFEYEEGLRAVFYDHLQPNGTCTGWRPSESRSILYFRQVSRINDFVRIKRGRLKELELKAGA